MTRMSHHPENWGLRLMVERLFVERLFTDGQLMEGQHVEITEFKVYKVLHSKGEI